MVFRRNHRLAASGRELRTWSWFSTSLTGAGCDRAHLGNSIFSILDQYLKNAVVHAYLDGARPAWSDYGLAARIGHCRPSCKRLFAS